MTFAKHFEQGPPIKRQVCAVAQLAADLRTAKRQADADGLEKIVDAIRAGRQAGQSSKTTWNAMMLHRIMKEDGFDIGRSTLERHISMICSCRDTHGTR